MSLPPITEGIWYAREKFQRATHMLAAGDAPLRVRLREANRIVAAVLLRDLPADAARDLEAFRARTGWADDATGEGTLAATLALVSDRECRRLLELLCAVDAAITEHLLDLARRP